MVEGTGIALAELEIDNAVFQLIANPGQFDVVLSPNMFGDVLADCAALLLASRGLSYSGNFNDAGNAVYQTGHGAARDIAGKDVANPIGQILSLGMMLRESFCWPEADAALRQAVRETLKPGQVHKRYRHAGARCCRHRRVRPAGQGEPRTAAGRRERASGTTALLLVDCQEDYFARDGLQPPRETLVAAISDALAAARAKGWPIFHVRTRVAKDGSDAMPHRRRRARGGRGKRWRGPAVGLIEAWPASRVFYKRFFSAFDADGLEEALRTADVERLLVGRSPQPRLRAGKRARRLCPGI